MESGPAATAQVLPSVNAGSARSLLLTVLGEFVMPDDKPVWTASLLYALTGLGLSDQTARQAIVRGSASGWIEPEKRGREVRWRLTEHGRELLLRGERRVYSLVSDSGPWDNSWLIAFVSIPRSQRTVRKKLYSALERAGLGNPSPGVWLTPHRDRIATVERIVERFELGDLVLSFIGPGSGIGISNEDIVAKSWNLEQVQGRYEALLTRFSGSRPAAGNPIMFTHLMLINDWQQLPEIDPQLPEELLPDWIGRRATRVFTDLRAQWADAARQRWLEVVEATAAR